MTKYYLSSFYENGICIKKNPKLSLKLVKEAAGSGNLAASEKYIDLSPCTKNRCFGYPIQWPAEEMISCSDAFQVLMSLTAAKVMLFTFE